MVSFDLGGVTSSVGGAVSGLGGLASGMAQLTYDGLKKKYADFGSPRARVTLGGKEFDSVGKGMIVSEIHVELTSGYEASAATIRICDVYDTDSGKFFYSKVKKEVLLGNSVTLELGYLGKLETVFVGFISGVAFGFEPQNLPYIEVTAMDVKGLMMGGSYAAQLTATTYSSAVKEVLRRTGEGRLQQLGGITEPPAVSNTPDADSVPPAGSSSPLTVEMVNESDYEFVVRAAKRYNYEFFVDRGKVLFRPAKSDESLLITLGSQTGLQSFRIEYSITGVVGKIEARAMDPSTGKMISASGKNNNKISTGSKAKQLVGPGAKVYVDASITSQEEAEARVSSLMEQMSYRLGDLEASCVGMPDLLPGRFIEVKGLGNPADNRFYLTEVVHDFTSDSGYSTKIKGCAAQLQNSL